MTVDLLPLPYTHARELINYCAERNIDRDKVVKILEAFTTAGSSLLDEQWTIEVPDHIITYFLLKWAR